MTDWSYYACAVCMSACADMDRWVWLLSKTIGQELISFSFHGCHRRANHRNQTQAPVLPEDAGTRTRARILHRRLSSPRCTGILRAACGLSYFLYSVTVPRTVREHVCNVATNTDPFQCCRPSIYKHRWVFFFFFFFLREGTDNVKMQTGLIIFHEPQNSNLHLLVAKIN